MRRALVALLLGAVLALICGPSAQAATTSTVDRVIKDPRISENSGLIASPLHPGVLWTHNDSGHLNQIFAIARNGSTAATITVAGAQDRDWEAITDVRDLPGSASSMIAIGDIGDNDYRHPYSRIYIVPEPRTLTSQTIRVQREIRFRFPGGPRNAEALLAQPGTGHLYVVTKDLFSAQIYEIPTSAWPDMTTGTSPIVQATLIASSSANFITDGTFLPDGRMLIRGYGRIYLLDKPGNAKNGRLNPLKSAPLPDEEQGEALTVIDGGAQALIGSEGVKQPVLKIDLTALGMASGASVAKPVTSSGNSAEASSSSGLTDDGAPSQRLLDLGGRTWIVVVAGGAAIILLGIGVVVLVSRGGSRRARG